MYFIYIMYYSIAWRRSNGLTWKKKDRNRTLRPQETPTIKFNFSPRKSPRAVQERENSVKLGLFPVTSIYYPVQSTSSHSHIQSKWRRQRPWPPPILKPQTSPPNSPVSLNGGSRTCRPHTQTWSVCSSLSSPVYAIVAPTMRGPASWECKPVRVTPVALPQRGRAQSQNKTTNKLPPRNTEN